MLNPKKQKCKTVKDVARILSAMVPSKYHFGAGLYLCIDGASASWKHRFQKDGKEHWAGLLVADVADLQEAKRRHLGARQQVMDGSNPIELRRALRADQKAKQAARHSFRECAEEYLEIQKKHKWKARHRGTYVGWKNSLETYVYPKIGDLDVSDIDRPHIKAVLKQPAISTPRHAGGGPLWDTRPHTGHFVRNRIELIIDYAIAHRYRRFREGLDENPARRNIVEAMIGSPSRGVTHLDALPYKHLPGFMAKLRGDVDGHGVAAMAAEFLILTQVRLNEVCCARWSEIHLDPKQDPHAPVWRIPGPRMKGRRTIKQHDHWVPLSPEAVEILNAVPREEGNPWVFISTKKRGWCVGHSSVGKLPQRFGYDGDKLPKCTMHGFRATMGEWGYLPENDYHKDLLDFCWAHKVGDMTTQAYLRTTKFDQRRELLSKWGAEITAGLRPLRTEAVREAEAKERLRIAQQEWKASHPDEIKAYASEYRRTNREHLRALAKAWSAANPESVQEHQHRYYEANSETEIGYQKGYMAGLRKEYNIPVRTKGKRTTWKPTTPESERAYQSGYRAGRRRAKKNPDGIKGYKPRAD